MIERLRERAERVVELWRQREAIDAELQAILVPEKPGKAPKPPKTKKGPVERPNASPDPRGGRQAPPESVPRKAAGGKPPLTGKTKHPCCGSMQQRHKKGCRNKGAAPVPADDDESEAVPAEKPERSDLADLTWECIECMQTVKATEAPERCSCGSRTYIQKD